MLEEPFNSKTRRLDLLGGVWLLICLGLAYGNDMGRGFITDDFSWIYSSRVRAPGDLIRFITEAPMGFYRPLVSLSFAVDHWLYGMAPMGYAITNFAIALGTVAGIVALVRTLDGSVRAGLFAGGLWVFNFHGVPMALTWISGRTSLLTTLFAVLTALSMMQRRRLLTGVFMLCALLSKEEPVMLPFILTLWALLDAVSTRRFSEALVVAAQAAWPSFAALLVYAALRSQTDAITPSTAPAFYVLTPSARLLLSNVPEYVDRSLTFVVAVLLLGFLVFARRRFALNATERAIAIKGAVWLVLGFAVTVMLPIRSDLYATFPSVGSALIGMAVGTAIWRVIPRERHRIAVIAICLLPLPLLPIYWARNWFPKQEAMFTARVIREVTSVLSNAPTAAHLEFYENREEHPSLSSAFGETMPRAIELMTGRVVTAETKDSAVNPPTADRPPNTLRFLATDDLVRPLE